MKLLTLNCHSWQEENQIEKIAYIASVINEKQYDVIALQEVSQLVDEKIVYDNVKENNFALLLQKELKKLGDSKYEFYWDIAHMGYDIYEEGLCLMTKLPIVKKESFYVSKETNIEFWKTRKIVSMTVMYNNENIDFYSCHLGWWNDDDEPFDNQFNNLMKYVGKNNKAFIMGDFNNNANIKNEGYDYIQKHLLDTYNMASVKDIGITVKGKIAGWDKNNEDLRLDLVLTNKDIEIVSSRVIFNGINKEIVSDHYGVEVVVGE